MCRAPQLPTDAEWIILINYLEGEGIAGGKLKSTSNWSSPNIGATNSSGFTALPGGFRYNYGEFIDIYNYGCWWSSSDFSFDGAWYMFIRYESSYAIRDYDFKASAYSVRCLRDS